MLSSLELPATSFSGQYQYVTPSRVAPLRQESFDGRANRCFHPRHAVALDQLGQHPADFAQPALLHRDRSIFSLLTSTTLRVQARGDTQQQEETCQRLHLSPPIPFKITRKYF